MLLISALPFQVFGQADVATGTLKGSVLDPNGAVVSGATITLRSLDRGTARTVKSNADGTYQIQLIQPGSYHLQVEGHGFDKEAIDGINISVGQILVYDI